jgi:hypothetical protein
MNRFSSKQMLSYHVRGGYFYDKLVIRRYSFYCYTSISELIDCSFLYSIYIRMPYFFLFFPFFPSLSIVIILL